MHEDAYFMVEEIFGERDMNELKNQLSSLHGVQNVLMDDQNSLFAIQYNSAGVSYDNIEHCLNQMGYQIAADASEIHTR